MAVRRISRRLLLDAASAGLIWLGRQKLRAQSPRHPEISSFDLSLLDDWITPAELFFVREHFPAPPLSSQVNRLAITGALAAPFEISYDELQRKAQKNLAVTLECAENPVNGGLVSNAEWRGVPLCTLLETAAPLPAARFVRLEGADGYTRVIPLAKAQHPDTLVVYHMNGDKLRESHGAPLRAVVPGWYGMDSVKWLRKVDLLRHGTNDNYLRRNRTGSAEPITAINVKSAFARPLEGAVLFPRPFLMRGIAWAGENKVRDVEVSTDGGASWQAASLVDSPLPYAWVRWQMEWKIPGPGSYDLAVRATDEAGNQQPLKRDPMRSDDCEQNACQHVRVTVA